VVVDSTAAVAAVTLAAVATAAADTGKLLIQIGKRDELRLVPFCFCEI
jgi:hypothetical protein